MGYILTYRKMQMLWRQARNTTHYNTRHNKEVEASPHHTTVVEGRKGGMGEGRKQTRKQSSKQARKQGSNEGSNEGCKGERKEATKDAWEKGRKRGSEAS